MASFPQVVFEDQHLLVISKPWGWLSQPGSSEGPLLQDWISAHVRRPYVGVVHRLDRNTTGLMVFGKRTKATARLQESLKNNSLRRVYKAVLVSSLELRAPPVNWVVGAKESWEDSLLKSQDQNTTRVVSASTPGARSAVLQVQCLRLAEAKAKTGGRPLCLAEFRLQTGRSHQIRVQSAHRGWPVLGDTKYGSSLSCWNLPALALQSSQMSFPHPMSGELLSFEEPLRPDMESLFS